VIRQTLTDVESRALDRLSRDAITGFYAVLDALIREGS